MFLKHDVVAHLKQMQMVGHNPFQSPDTSRIGLITYYQQILLAEVDPGADFPIPHHNSSHSISKFLVMARHSRKSGASRADWVQFFCDGIRVKQSAANSGCCILNSTRRTFFTCIPRMLAHRKKKGFFIEFRNQKRMVASNEEVVARNVPATR